MKPAFRFLALPLCLPLIAAILLAPGCAGRRDSPRVRAAQADIESEANTYPAELANAHRIGLSLSMSDLDRPPEDPERNAASVYRQLGHMLRAYPLNSRELALEGLSTAPLPTTRALGFARAALAHRAKYLQMIHQAARMPVCVFHHNWTTPDPENITFPELGTVREASLLVTGQSVLMAEAGKPVPAVANEAVCFRLANQIAGEKILAAYGVACDIDFVAFTTLQKILYLSHGDPKVAQAVQTAIANGWRAHSLVAALDSESAFQQGMVKYARSAGPAPYYDTIVPGLVLSGLPARELSSSAEWNKIMDANNAVLLGETARAAAAADKPYPVAQPIMSAIVADSMPRLPSRAMSAILVPNFTSYLTQRAQDQARARIIQTAASVLAWKAAHGKFPSSLADMGSPAPLDPFCGKPLRYRLEGAGFVLYSVGPDSAFDGGTPRSEPSQAQSLFRWPLPPYDFPAKPLPAVNA